MARYIMRSSSDFDLQSPIAFIKRSTSSPIRFFGRADILTERLATTPSTLRNGVVHDRLVKGKRMTKAKLIQPHGM